MLNISIGTLAQADTLYLKTIYKAIKTIDPTTTIYYTDRVDNGVLEKHLNALAKRNIKSIKVPKSSAIKLSHQERKYLIEQLKKSTKPYWPDRLFVNSKKISVDSLQYFIAIQTQELKDSIQTLTPDSLRNVSFKLGYANAVFMFSDEIYIRNKSVFLQYFMWFNGSGSEKLSFYKKVKEEWKEWILVSAGDW